MADTDGRDAPACGPGERPPTNSLVRPRWCGDGMGTLWALPSSGPPSAVLRVGGIPSSHEDSKQGSPEQEGQSRGGSEMMFSGQPGPLPTSDSRVSVRLPSQWWALSPRAGLYTCAHSCLSSPRLWSQFPFYLLRFSIHAGWPGGRASR